MGKALRRTPLGYDGTQKTAQNLNAILPLVMSSIDHLANERPDLVLAAWPEVIGSQLAPMTQAVKWVEGVLFVRVKNSTLFQLLSQRDKPKIVRALRKRFPNTKITDVVFHMR